MYAWMDGKCEILDTLLLSVGVQRWFSVKEETLELVTEGEAR